jgi:hypothetical protein
MGRFAPLFAIMITACSSLSPHPFLDCSGGQADPNCMAVLTQAAKAFPTAIRLRMSDRIPPATYGAEFWYVEVTSPHGHIRTITCDRPMIATITCSVPDPVPTP